MSTRATDIATPAISLTPPADRTATTAELLGMLLAGVPYRDGLRPAAAPVRRPATAEEGIEWIMRGPRH